MIWEFKRIHKRFGFMAKIRLLKILNNLYTKVGLLRKKLKDEYSLKKKYTLISYLWFIKLNSFFFNKFIGTNINKHEDCILNF